MKMALLGLLDSNYTCCSLANKNNVALGDATYNAAEKEMRCRVKEYLVQKLEERMKKI
eukprot:CAMPEP_0172321464 /NCGR_PEP_ID=MMETSP1058-20130122/43496_1 /TAXON_ID=83371 /ORGANISM="Detonula confervacea, Strain CCMP 353" /LENGTH=57 /DNA_ID=CAMNT_0013036981 /DNA_START=53 /DNA_END=226 /DNA_ORIENTATION=-